MKIDNTMPIAKWMRVFHGDREMRYVIEVDTIEGKARSMMGPWLDCTALRFEVPKDAMVAQVDNVQDVVKQIEIDGYTHGRSVTAAMKEL